MTADLAVLAADASPPGVRGLRRARPTVPATLVALLLINLLVLTGVPAPIRAVVVLPVVVLLPGAWAMRILRLDRPPGWDALLHAVALGVFVLLVTSFAVAVVPVGGALSPVGCLIAFDVALMLLTAAAFVRDRRRAASPGAEAPSGVRRTRSGRAVRSPGSYRRVGWIRPPVGSAAVALAALAVILAVLGAVRLNADRGSTVAALALTVGAMALLAAALPGRGGTGADDTSVREQLAATTVYLLGLAVLLATSLRGVGVTGHDIKIEMHVLQDTLTAGGWLPGGMAPDYTACLSVTTLPAFLHHLLDLAPLDIFRICYQVLFAVVGVGVFLLARHLLPIGGAVAAAGLFIAFPAFVNDMPMLNRQELALIFFTVALLALLDQRGSHRLRLATFVIMSAGLTVSHYSSTYVAIGMLLSGWLLLRVPAGRWFARPSGAARRSAPAPVRWTRRVLAGVPAWRQRTTQPPLLRLWLIGLLMVFSVGWSMCSGSGGGLVRTVSDTLAAVQRSNGGSADAVGYSIFGPRLIRSDEQVLRDYVTARGGGVDPRVLDRLAITCPTDLVPTDVLPVTLAGRTLQAGGVEPATANLWSRRGAVALFQLGGVLGVLLLWLATRAVRGPGRVLAALGGGALGLLAATVVLPQLSLSYGLLRLFQQSLVVVAPLIVLALTAVLAPAGRDAARAAIAVLVTACFVSTSGLLPQLIGGYQPQLNLNNSGPYHRAWYAAADDVTLARWAGENLPAGTVLTADTAQTALLRATTRIDPREGVAPGIVGADAYLMVSVLDPETVQAVAVADDRILLFRFPLRCVSAGRPLLYSRDDHRVYGPVG